MGRCRWPVDDRARRARGLRRASGAEVSGSTAAPPSLLASVRSRRQGRPGARISAPRRSPSTPMATCWRTRTTPHEPRCFSPGATMSYHASYRDRQLPGDADMSSPVRGLRRPLIVGEVVGVCYDGELLEFARVERIEGDPGAGSPPRGAHRCRASRPPCGPWTSSGVRRSDPQSSSAPRDPAVLLRYWPNAREEPWPASRCRSALLEFYGVLDVVVELELVRVGTAAGRSVGNMNRSTSRSGRRRCPQSGSRR